MDAYIAKKECGCIVMACVDNPEHRRETAKEVAKAIRQGYIIERASAELTAKLVSLREHWFCPTHAQEHLEKQVMQRLIGEERRNSR